MLDESGKYSEDALEMDKKRIEYHYREYGYLMAKVANVDVKFLKNDTQIEITFDIREGDRFKIRYVGVPGDEVYTEEELLPYVEIEAGEYYSQSKLIKTIERLKAQWGELGYIYADVYPQIVPNEETKEVDITFHAEKGKKMFVNRIDITGNKVTKDRVIRRELMIEEGDLITSKKMKNSKNNVEYLGFFERGSVNWKLHRIADDQADAELNVKEAKTGKANIAFNYGSDKGTASRAFRASLSVEKSNFLGRGWDIGAGLQGSVRRFQSASLFFFDPHIFDTDISFATSLFVKQEVYEQWNHVTPKPIERVIGTSSSVGFLLPKVSRRMRFGIDVGYENIRHNSPKALTVFQSLQPIVDRTFQEGDLTWIGASLTKDTRNHRVYPTQGYKAILGFKSAPPGINSEFGFYKTELEWTWYTPLIGEDALVLMLHASAGIVNHVTYEKIIPYKELFHMGGQSTVRGFVWGGIGPAWSATGAPLGARKAFQFNTELIFPLVSDYRMKGHFFYDAGAGWDTPKNGVDDSSKIKRDKFNLRHSVGFGLNLTNPFPAKIDWGYKLDRDKAAGESPHEFHISMNKAW
jgi:outer membrane protein insertion porin family